jgi:hypothetical protein
LIVPKGHVTVWSVCEHGITASFTDALPKLMPVGRTSTSVAPGALSGPAFFTWNEYAKLEPMFGDPNGIEPEI